MKSPYPTSKGCLALCENCNCEMADVTAPILEKQQDTSLKLPTGKVINLTDKVYSIINMDNEMFMTMNVPFENRKITVMGIFLDLKAAVFYRDTELLKNTKKYSIYEIEYKYALHILHVSKNLDGLILLTKEQYFIILPPDINKDYAWQIDDTGVK